MHISTVNAQGLGGIRKRQNFDIITVTETNCFTLALGQKMGERIGREFFWSFASESGSGVGIFLNKKFRGTVIHFWSNFSGRLISLKIKLGNSMFGVIGVYLHSKEIHEKIKILFSDVMDERKADTLVESERKIAQLEKKLEDANLVRNSLFYQDLSMPQLDGTSDAPWSVDFDGCGDHGSSSTSVGFTDSNCKLLLYITFRHQLSFK